MRGGCGPGALSGVNVPAASTLLAHPRTVYLPEADLLPPPGRLARGLVGPADEVEWFRGVLACSWSRRRCQWDD